MNEIPIIIPAYEPDDRLPALLEELMSSGIGPVVVVNDGSGPEYDKYYTEAETKYGCILIKHAVNLGKGRALKNAFNYCINTWPDMIGCITADSDGQHTVECIRKCKDALIAEPDNLVLGVRDFSGDDIPWKSRFGNNITRVVCKLLTGLNIKDTQTGLRGIPLEFMKTCMSIVGERFEFETRMLVESKEKCDITQVPIKTIYDSKENHTTHFNPVKDSIRIYKIFGGMFIKFVFSALSSSVIDLVLFSVFCGLLKGAFGTESVLYVTVATVLARIISATYNYLINYRVVFKSSADHRKSAIRYATLAIIQGTCSAVLVTLGVKLLPAAPELLVKIVVDVVLFFISYTIQREVVYKNL